MKLRVALSTCPNDTFAFHGLMSGRIPTPGLELEFVLGDIEELNERFIAGEFQLSKLSFSAALQLTNEISILESGSALGFGVGPLLLAADKEQDRSKTPAKARVLSPGRHTTAHLLLRLFQPQFESVETVEFSEIMSALESGAADYGVCIHEGRFTFKERGLHLVEDFGARWEQETHSPLPLGGIAARRSVPHEVRARFAGLLRQSIDYGFAHRAEAFETMRLHAQELAADVIEAHVDLYVNSWTRRLGEAGERALAELAQRIRPDGKAPSPGLEIDRDPGADSPRMFHLLTTRDFDRFEASGSSELDTPSFASEGFVHASFLHQLGGSLRKHFAGEDAIELLELRLAPTDPALRIELGRAGEAFPHLYRPLRRSDVRRRHSMSRGTAGWSWPKLDA